LLGGLLNIPEISLKLSKFGGASGAGCPCGLFSKDGISILISSIGIPENALARILGIEFAVEGIDSPGPPLPVRKAGSSGADCTALGDLLSEPFLISHGNSVIETSHIIERD
jgi:hypothetical protein